MERAKPCYSGCTGYWGWHGTFRIAVLLGRACIFKGLAPFPKKKRVGLLRELPPAQTLLIKSLQWHVGC